MIDVTVAEVVRRAWRRVGVLGFEDPWSRHTSGWRRSRQRRDD
jgi:hypothetical protein